MSQRKRRRGSKTALMAISMAAASILGGRTSVDAATVTYVWQPLSAGDASGSWNTPANWSPSGPAVGVNGATLGTNDGVADFSTANIAADSTVTLDTNQHINNIKFGDTTTSSAAGWTLSAGSGGILTLDTLLGGAPGNAPAPTITVNALGTGKSVNISAQIAGADGLIKAGAGTLILSSASGNTYTGFTNLTGGTLSISNVNQLSTGGLNFTTTAGVTFNANGTLSLPSSTGITLGIDTNITGTSLAVNGTFTNSGRVLTNNTSSGVSLVGNVFLSDAPAVAKTLTIAGTGNTSVTGAISNVNGVGLAGNLIVQVASASQVTLSGNNIYTGATTVSRGNLAVGADAISTTVGSSSVTANAGTDLITLSGNTLINGNKVVFGGTTVPGGLTAGTVYFVVNQVGNDFQVSTSSGGSAINLTSTGTSVVASRPGALGSTNSAVVLGDANTGGANTVGLLTSAGVAFERPITVANQGNGTTIGGSTDATSTFSGNITLNKAAKLTSAAVTGSNAVDFSGDITGAQNVTILGTGPSNTGVVKFSTAKSYTGTTTINTGATLLVNSTLASSSITVNGTLGGTGSVSGNVTVSGGTIAPGASIESLDVGGSVTLNGTLKIELDGTLGGLTDLLNVVANLNITGATIDFSQLTAVDDNNYVFATYGTLTGTAFATISNLPSGYQIDYNYNNLNEIALVQSAIPEPFALPVLGMGAFALLARRRRNAI